MTVRQGRARRQAAQAGEHPRADGARARRRQAGRDLPRFAHKDGDAVSQHLRDHGVDIDWSKLDLSQLDTVLQNLDETTIDVDKGKAQVRISYE